MKKPIIFTIIGFAAILLVFIEINRSHRDVEEHQALIDFVKIHRGLSAPEIVSRDSGTGGSGVSIVTAEAGGRTFKVLTRQDQMTIQNCSSCHTGPLEKDRANSTFIERKSHWEISSPHGKAVNVNCTTCHNQDDVSRLNVGMVKTVGFDEVFQSCAVCHSQEFKDWSGGAHGKRAVGWGSERIVNNCTTCHNPHSPGFPTRRPAIMSPVPEP